MDANIVATAIYWYGIVAIILRLCSQKMDVVIQIQLQQHETFISFLLFLCCFFFTAVTDFITAVVLSSALGFFFKVYSSSFGLYIALQIQSYYCDFK